MIAAHIVVVNFSFLRRVAVELEDAGTGLKAEHIIGDPSLRIVPLRASMR